MTASEKQIVVYQPNETVRLNMRLENVQTKEPPLQGVFNNVVRLNIRPFYEAGVLRGNMTAIKWGKNCSAGLPPSLWNPVFHGDRINNHHTTLAEKSAAREAAK